MKYGWKRPEYMCWSSMKQRCQNPKATVYKFYGARGITVCERWMLFDDFLADMGPRPAGTTLDRIDSNGNYEPGNCRWANHIEQHNNTRRNRTITIGGRTQTIAQWAREAGLKRNTLRYRLEIGHPHENLLEPAGTSRAAKRREM